MAEVALVTTFSEPKNRGGSQSGPISDQLSFAANTSEAKQYILAPVTGKIIAGEVQGAVTSDGTKTYTYVVTNKSTAKTAVASTVFDADPVLTAFTKASLTPSTTAADVAVTRGDMIEVSFTGGTGSGATGVILYFEEL